MATPSLQKAVASDGSLEDISGPSSSTQPSFNSQGMRGNVPQTTTSNVNNFTSTNLNNRPFVAFSSSSSTFVNTTTSSTRSSSSFIRSNNHNNNYDFDDSPIPFKYTVVPVDSSKGVRIFSETFPRQLNGIVDRADYIQVVKGVNEVILRAIDKKKYSRGVSNSLLWSGLLVGVPLIPLSMIEHHKAKQIKQRMNDYLNIINPQFAYRGMKWVQREHPIAYTPPGEFGTVASVTVYDLILEVNDISASVDDDDLLLYCMSEEEDI